MAIDRQQVQPQLDCAISIPWSKNYFQLYELYHENPHIIDEII